MASSGNGTEAFDAYSANPGAFDLDEVIAKSLAGLIAGIKLRDEAKDRKVSAQGFRDQVAAEAAAILRTYNGQPINELAVLGDLTLGDLVTNNIWPGDISSTEAA